MIIQKGVDAYPAAYLPRNPTSTVKDCIKTGLGACYLIITRPASSESLGMTGLFEASLSHLSGYSALSWMSSWPQLQMHRHNLRDRSTLKSVRI